MTMASVSRKHHLDEHDMSVKEDDAAADGAVKKTRIALVSSNSSSSGSALSSFPSSSLHPTPPLPASSISASPSPSSSPSLPSASASPKAAFTSFLATLGPQTNDLLHSIIPQRVLQLHEYIANLEPFTHSLTVPPPPSASSPVLAITAAIPPHPLLSRVLPELHASLSQLLLHLSQLKLHIQLLIPPTDDSNTFGVEIQQEAITVLTQYEDAHFALLDRIPSYSASRAKLCSKICKYPACEDYRLAVQELDAGMWCDVRVGLVEERECYMQVLDLLKKNEQRLRDPKGEQYRAMAM